jgi:hypothetical protein
MAYYVKPRYTPGSPSMVDRVTAERVAREERESHKHGLHGDGEAARAQLLGLRGIVEVVDYRGDTRHARDLITDETLVLTGAQSDLLDRLRQRGGLYLFSLAHEGHARVWVLESDRTLREVKPPREVKAFGELRRAGFFVENAPTTPGMSGHTWHLPPWFYGKGERDV